MTESCANCRFWRLSRIYAVAPEKVGDSSADCLRRSPIRENGWTNWPSTYPSYWCGEWEAIRETHSGDPKNDDGQTGDGAISYADILVCASIRGNCGTVHSSFEEWKNCLACDLPPLPWSIRAQIFKDEEPPK